MSDVTCVSRQSSPAMAQLLVVTPPILSYRDGPDQRQPVQPGVQLSLGWCRAFPCNSFPFRRTLALMSKHLSSAEDVISNKVYLLKIFTQINSFLFVSTEDYLLTMIFISGDANYGNRQPALV